MNHTDWWLPFHIPNEGDSHFYALAGCTGNYQQRKGWVPVQLGLYFSPSPGFTRFSFHGYGSDRSYQYGVGAEYSADVAATLLEATLNYGVPGYHWRLHPRNAFSPFARPKHERAYECERNKLCHVLYALHTRAWADHELKVEPSFRPNPVVPSVDTLEYAEELEAKVNTPEEEMPGRNG